MPRKPSLGRRRPVYRLRRRRTPEAARKEILDAAERVFSRHNPDDVGLKHVATEAGVSHALVTHYFGTYAGLVEAALERRIRALRELVVARLQQAGAVERPGELLDLLFVALEDPVHQRLMKWLVGSERPAAAYAFAVADRGLQRIAQQVAEALLEHPTPQAVETLELALVTAVSAAYGYTMTKPSLAGALGRPVSPALDQGVRRTLAGMLQSYLRDQLGVPAA